MAYGIDRYVGWRPRSDPVNGCDPSKGQNKFWSDIWEAFWGVIFHEREVWNEDIEDILSILRHLIFRKYSAVIEKYSTIYVRDVNPENMLSRFIDTDHADISVKGIDRDDPYVTECLGPGFAGDEECNYGYLATAALLSNSSSDTGTRVSIYAVHKETAISRALFYLNFGCKGIRSTFFH